MATGLATGMRWRWCRALARVRGLRTEATEAGHDPGRWRFLNRASFSRTASHPGAVGAEPTSRSVLLGGSRRCADAAPSCSPGLPGVLSVGWPCRSQRWAARPQFRLLHLRQLSVRLRKLEVARQQLQLQLRQPEAKRSTWCSPVTRCGRSRRASTTVATRGRWRRRLPERPARRWSCLASASRSPEVAGISSADWKERSGVEGVA